MTVALVPADYAAVARLAASSGDSVSSIIAGLVAAVAPSLERAAVMQERAQAAPAEVLAGLREAATAADQTIETILQSAIDGVDAEWSGVEDLLSETPDL